MSRSVAVLRKLGLILLGLFTVYALLGWLAVPRLLHWQATKFIAEKTGHRLSLDMPVFDPFDARLELANLRLEEPDGKPLLAFRGLRVDLSAASILRRALVFDAIRLDAPAATVVLLRDGRLNWSAFLDALKSKEETPDEGLPRLDVTDFTLAEGRVDFSDERAGFSTRIEPLDLELNELATLPDEQGRHRLAARTAFGAQVTWRGEATLNPLAATGQVRIEALDLASLAPYLKQAPIAGPAGKLTAATAYHAAYADGRLALTLDRMTAELAGLRLTAGKAGGPTISVASIEALGGRYELAANRFSLGALRLGGTELRLPRPDGGPVSVRLGAATLDQLQADLAARNLSVAAIALADGQLKATRDAAGRVDLAEALQAASAAFAGSAPAEQPAPAPAAPWHYRVGKVALSGFSTAFQDESVQPAAALALEDISISVSGVSDRLDAPLPLQASFRARDGGSFEAEGEVVPAAPSAELRLKLTDLTLTPAQPYLASVARLTLAGGTLSVEGTARYAEEGTGFKGGFSVNDLRVNEAESGNLFLAWKSLGTQTLQVSETRLGMADLALVGLDTQVIIDEDKSVNLARVLRKPEAPAATAAPAPPAAKKRDDYLVTIGRLRVRNSEMDFADRSLALPFGTRIHRLRGVVVGLSSRPGAPGQVELDGQVDDYGLARAVGQIDLFEPTRYTDLKVIFRNVEMTRLTPYSATFAGRKINSGKLSLDLEYKVKDRQLAGDNQVIMDQLVLGERVESPTAVDLPLDLAIAVLQDSDGRIDLGLPVSGNLDDPQFSYGAIIWKAIVNVVTKIVTAPFRALGALFGGAEKFESIAFEAGEAQLTPPEKEKVMRLAAALEKRPRLALTVHGVYADADRVALQDRALRRAIAGRMGLKLHPKADPGPMSTNTPEVQEALEELFSDRLGSGELAALKDGFRQANPGQLPQSVAGRMFSRLSGAFREQRTLGEQEVAQLKGADFHAVLYERLRRGEAVGDEQLLALAAARGEGIANLLQGAKVPAGRLSLAGAEKVEGDGGDIPIKLELGATAAAP